MGSDSSLKSGPAPAGLVEHGGVGDLHLGDRERPVEPTLAVVEHERVGATAISRANRSPTWPAPSRAQI